MVGCGWLWVEVNGRGRVTSASHSKYSIVGVQILDQGGAGPYPLWLVFITSAPQMSYLSGLLPYHPE